MPLNKSAIKKILVISLSNIGDVILTFPVVDVLCEDFPDALVSLVIGPKSRTLLKGAQGLEEIMIYDKHQSVLKTIVWLAALRKKKFDMVVDLRHTAIPLFLSPRYRTPLRWKVRRDQHMTEKHLSRLAQVYFFDPGERKRRLLAVPPGDMAFVRGLVSGITQPFVVICPGAADHSKKWTEEGFAKVCDLIIEKHRRGIVFAGDQSDDECAKRVMAKMKKPALNLCGQTSLIQLAGLFRLSRGVVANDSAPMHLASYLNLPVVALFGPTEPQRYGPWSRQGTFLRHNRLCPACQHPHISGAHQCMQAISFNAVFEAVEKFILKRESSSSHGRV